MLDKSRIYTGYSGVEIPGKKHVPQAKFKRVRILFEDNVSYYVESLMKKDSRGLGVRYSVKKHCFFLKEVSPEPKVTSHNICPFCNAGKVPTIRFFRVVPRVFFNLTKFELLAAATLAIEDGRVVKNKFGSAGRIAGAGDYERADLIIKRNRVVRNSIATGGGRSPNFSKRGPDENS